MHGIAGPEWRRQEHAYSQHCGPCDPGRRKGQVFGDRADSPGARTALGWVPQDLALYPRLTCRENLESFGLYHGLRREELRTAVAWCLDWAALRDRAEESVKSLSGGMKRRLNMAAGLIHHPRLVLMDEPTVGVDPQSRQRIFEMIEKLHGEGMSIVYTTHYMEEAELLCDRVATSLAHPTGTYSTRLRQNRFEGQLNIGHHYFGSASHLNGPEHDFAGR